MQRRDGGSGADRDGREAGQEEGGAEEGGRRGLGCGVVRGQAGQEEGGPEEGSRWREEAGREEEGEEGRVVVLRQVANREPSSRKTGGLCFSREKLLRDGGRDRIGAWPAYLREHSRRCWRSLCGGALRAARARRRAGTRAAKCASGCALEGGARCIWSRWAGKCLVVGVGEGGCRRWPSSIRRRVGAGRGRRRAGRRAWPRPGGGLVRWSGRERVAAWMALLVVVPFGVVLATSFIKFAVVLAILRRALGGSECRPAGDDALAFLFALFVTAPVGEKVWAQAQPAMSRGRRAVAAGDGGGKAAEPVRAFLMQAHARARAAELLRAAAAAAAGGRARAVGEHDLMVLAPAFATAELRAAFQVGFLLFLPFLVIELVVRDGAAVAGDEHAARPRWCRCRSSCCCSCSPTAGTWSSAGWCRLHMSSQRADSRVARRAVPGAAAVGAAGAGGAGGGDRERVFADGDAGARRQLVDGAQGWSAALVRAGDRRAVDRRAGAALHRARCWRRCRARPAVTGPRGVVAAARMPPVAFVAPPLGGRRRRPRLVLAGVLTALVAPAVRRRVSGPWRWLGREAAGRAGAGAGGGGAVSRWREAGRRVGRSRRATPTGAGAVLGRRFALLALALFAALDGPRLLVSGAGRELRGVSRRRARSHAAGGRGVTLEAGARLSRPAIALAAPALAALLLAELMAGAGRCGRSRRWSRRSGSRRCARCCDCGGRARRGDRDARRSAVRSADGGNQGLARALAEAARSLAGAMTAGRG